MAPLQRRDLVAGLVFILLALLVGVRAMQMRLGTAAAMGPGYFPLILAGLLLVLGLAVVATSLARTEALRWSMAETRGTLAVLGSVVLFGLLIRPAGFLIAATVTALVCQLGSPRFRPGRALVTAAGLSLAAFALFVWLLQIRLPVLPMGM